MSSRRQNALTIIGAAAGAYVAYRMASAASRRIEFRDRTVVITGGARGLGLVMARKLAAQGARLAICSRHADEVARAARELRSFGVPVVAQACDMTEPHEVDAFFQLVRTELGPIDVLINNAGVIQVGPLEEMTEDDYEQAMAIHFAAPLHAMLQVLPEMRRRGAGRIVNIASFGGLVAAPHLVPYSASKFALVGLSQGFRSELAKEGIYVTTICPGLMRTGSHARAWFKGQHRREYAWFSLGASAPLLAMSAERAADQILAACRNGRAHATLSLPAKLAAGLNAVAPELTADLASLVARILPKPGGVGERKVEGIESTSAWSPSIATLLGERAAIRNNEL